MKRPVYIVILAIPLVGLLLLGLSDTAISIADASVPWRAVGNHDASTEDFTTTSLKDVKTAIETVDTIRKMLYVFVRNYDGTPAVCEPVEWAIDDPYGIIDELYEGDEGSFCYNGCLDETCVRSIAADSRSAASCTREMTSAEIAKFTGAYIDAIGELSDSGVLLFDPAADENSEDYAIAGMKILSSLAEDVDITIEIHDCWKGEEEVITRDVMLLFFDSCLDNPAVEVGLASVWDELVMVYNWDNPTKEWSWYNPRWPADQNTLHLLLVYHVYWIKVSADCTLTYNSFYVYHSYDLYTGWNSIVWMGCLA